MTIKIKSHTEIARTDKIVPVQDIAAKLGIPEDALTLYGRTMAKVDPDRAGADKNKKGHLILVTAMSPTPLGEGKTTTAIGLGDALSLRGKKTALCLREPSLGPVFGMKGGGAGGGRAQVVPMENINLHFTGDLHAISAANNLLAAMIDNSVYWRSEVHTDNRRIAWRRVLDMNDRALRSVVIGLGGSIGGAPREDNFDITAASEIMAILCLAHDAKDLHRRLGNIVIGKNMEGGFERASEVKAQGAMTALLKDALLPNLVQTLEGTPAFIHGGPFANIAHGCSSTIATRTALGLADYVVTEAGFGADLGAEKFFNIKCRTAKLEPSAAVLVATVRAIKHHGGASKDDMAKFDEDVMTKGFANLTRHVENLRRFGVPVVVAINRFPTDSDEEIDFVRKLCSEVGVVALPCTHYADGGKGAEQLAEAVERMIAEEPPEFRLLYPDNMGLWDKVDTIARLMYGAQGLIADKKVRNRFKEFEDAGFGDLPVCIAKTPYSFSTDPDLLGAPSNHVVPIREIRLSGGAEFVVVMCGDIMTMPGLPRHPAAERIHINENGEIEGLF